MSYLNLAAIKECTQAEGPGKRFALWVQGCDKRCHGCCNEHMQSFEKKQIVDVRDLFSIILKSKSENKIEGVSFIGGEPILQAEGLSELATLCKKENLTVLVFTGYLYDELKKSDSSHIQKLLANTDLLVDGPFVESKYDTERDWIGSKNQKLYFLTNAYKAGIEKNYGEHKMELKISADKISINGWPF